MAPFLWPLKLYAFNITSRTFSSCVLRCIFKFCDSYRNGRTFLFIDASIKAHLYGNNILMEVMAMIEWIMDYQIDVYLMVVAVVIACYGVGRLLYVYSDK